MPRCSAVGSLRLPCRSLSLFHLGMACPVGFCCFGSASLRSFLGALARGLATRHSWCLGQARRPAAVWGRRPAALAWRWPTCSAACRAVIKTRTHSRGFEAVFRWGEKVGEKVTSVTVAHCSTFRLFVVNIVLL